MKWDDVRRCQNRIFLEFWNSLFVIKSFYFSKVILSRRKLDDESRTINWSSATRIVAYEMICDSADSPRRWRDRTSWGWQFSLFLRLAAPCPCQAQILPLVAGEVRSQLPDWRQPWLRSTGSPAKRPCAPSFLVVPSRIRSCTHKISEWDTNAWKEQRATHRDTAPWVLKVSISRVTQIFSAACKKHKINACALRNVMVIVVLVALGGRYARLLLTTLSITIQVHLNNRGEGILISLDVAGAFDRVWWGRLKARFKKRGMRRKALKLMYSYLKKRFFQVVTGGGKSDPNIRMKWH